MNILVIFAMCKELGIEKSLRHSPTLKELVSIVGDIHTRGNYYTMWYYDFTLGVIYGTLKTHWKGHSPVLRGQGKPSGI